MPATLTDILDTTRRRLEALRERRRELEVEAGRAPTVPAWRPAFETSDVAVIAEVKRRSPTAGAIQIDLDPGDLVTAYAAGGARAISVLTEAAYFGGSMADLEAARRAVAVPVLRKDFVIDPLQLYEAKAGGASAVLLIVRALEGSRLGELAAAAGELGLGRLVEVHDRSELERALAVGAETVGVNSRDLTTFAVNVDGMREVLGAIPSGTIAVAESGLTERAHVERVAEWGADAVLVGTALVRARDPERAVRVLAGVSRRGRNA